MSAMAIDPVTFLISQLDNVSATYLKDLSFIPADKLDCSPMGTARGPLNFTLECAGLNRFATRLLRDEPPMDISEQARERYFSAFCTKESIESEFRASVADLRAAIQAKDPESLSRVVETPFGRPESLYGIAFLAVSHMIYHDGQINYIQTLYGDDAIHWGA